MELLLALNRQLQLPPHQVERSPHGGVVRVEPFGSNRFPFVVVHIGIGRRWGTLGCASERRLPLHPCPHCQHGKCDQAGHNDTQDELNYLGCWTIEICSPG